MITQAFKRGQPPRVTVLMSMYNAESYLREAIESILGQTFTDFEFIIINDGSKDSSRDIVLSCKDSRIQLVENLENIGLTKSLNRGLALARGEYIARQDADDKSHSTRLARQVQYLDEHPQIAVLGTQARNMDESGRLYRPHGWERLCSEVGIRWLCMFESPFIHSSVMMRSKIVRDQYGGYNPDYTTSQDHEFWGRIVYNESCHNINEILIDFRTHPKSVSSNYSLAHMGPVAVTLHKAACAGLKQEPAEGWVEQWIQINNPSLYPDHLDILRIVEIIDEMHQRFVTINKVSQDHRDILQHKNCMLMRIAHRTVSIDKKASFILFWRVCRQDIKAACPFIPKYIFVALGGKRLRNFMVGLRKSASRGLA